MVNSQRHLIADRHDLVVAYCARTTEMNSSAFADSGSSRLVPIPYSRSVLGRLIGRRTRSARAWRMQFERRHPTPARTSGWLFPLPGSLLLSADLDCFCGPFGLGPGGIDRAARHH